ncbi:MAG TPA: ATP-binding protein [Acidimicrobiia bacterium]|nr:ATP-binding protein [Acidimicrobiia bacterium]
MESVETHLPPLPGSSATARAFLRDALKTWDLDGFGEVTEVLTTELVSNVVRHVGAPMTLRASRQASSIRIEVDDPSDVPPVVEHPGPLAERGRGVLLIDSLASQWGIEHRAEGGKTVWFEIDVSTATDEVHRT